MLIISRHRNETKFDTQLAETLAGNLETLVWSVPFLYDLKRTGKTAAALQTLDEPLAVFAPLPPRPLSILVQQITQREKPPAVFDSRLENVDLLCQAVREWQHNGLLPGNIPGGKVERLDEAAENRWYPMLDTERCIGCLECVNFCLFGVYAVGENDKPFVEQPDACRDGCPACSRVCPGKAIMFPLYDDPRISGERDDWEDELDVLVDEVDKFELRHSS
ncbi:MAG: hypothetical protein LBN39_05490 [Planctomycetaceae bacterium]|jgi:NAD-dependent dihydropyrimidine dehydrogenase PreA subunit|nr:hypothetical protein [Planctomycetaceae bacterium]